MPDAASPLADALARVGDRWTLLVVAALLDGPRRFGDLQERAGRHRTQRPHAPAAQSRGQGLVVGAALLRAPAALRLRAHGRRARARRPLRLLADWGARHADGAELPVHAACGTPLEAVWYCPTCSDPVERAPIEELDYA